MSNDRANPRTSNPSAPTLEGLGIFDMARWKPLSGDKFLEEMVALSMTHHDRVLVPSTVEDLPDGRVRIAYYADVVTRPGNRVLNEPYMSVLYNEDDDRSRPVAFVRTDVDLAQYDEAGELVAA